MLTRIIIFGMLGIIVALVVSAVRRSIAARQVQLTGEVSLVIFPLCGLGAILFPVIASRISALPWYGRGAVYMATIYVVQYAAGLALARLGCCPWSYEGRGSLGGLVRAADAPLWFASGLGLERAYPWIKSVAIAIT